MEIKFSVFTDKVACYEKLCTIRLWSLRQPPAPGDFLHLLNVSSPPSLLACGYCTAATPVIVTSDQRFCLDGKWQDVEAVRALALKDGFESLDLFWAFFLRELSTIDVDASSGWLIQWKRPDVG